MPETWRGLIPAPTLDPEFLGNQRKDQITTPCAVPVCPRSHQGRQALAPSPHLHGKGSGKDDHASNYSPQRWDWCWGRRPRSDTSAQGRPCTHPRVLLQEGSRPFGPLRPPSLLSSEGSCSPGCAPRITSRDLCVGKVIHCWRPGLFFSTEQWALMLPCLRRTLVSGFSE